jgi:hypothetical protein
MYCKIIVLLSLSKTLFEILKEHIVVPLKKKNLANKNYQSFSVVSINLYLLAAYCNTGAM